MEDSIISATLIYFRIVTCAFQLSKQLSLCTDFKFYSGYQTFFFFACGMILRVDTSSADGRSYDQGCRSMILRAYTSSADGRSYDQGYRGLVVPRPISANPGLNFNLGFFFVCVQVFLQKVFRSSNPVNFSVALRSRSFCGTKDSSFDVSGKIHCLHF